MNWNPNTINHTAQELREQQEKKLATKSSHFEAMIHMYKDKIKADKNKDKWEQYEKRKK